MRMFDVLKRYGSSIGLDVVYFVENGFAIAIRQVVAAFFGLLLMIVFSRLADKEILGQYQFILAIVYSMALFSLPGLNTSLLRSVARGYEGDYTRVVQLSFRSSMLSVVVLVCFGCYYFFLGNNNLGLAFVFSAFITPFFYAPNTWDSFLQGKSKFSLTSKWGSFQVAGTSLVTLVTLFLFPSSIFLILPAYLLTSSLFNILYYFWSLRLQENTKTDAEVFPYGFFLTKAGALGLIVDYFDKIILGFFNLGVLAAYSVSLSIVEFLKNFIKSVFSVTFPKLSKYEYGISSRMWGIALLGSAIFSLGLFFSSEKIVVTFFSGRYLDAAVFLKYTTFLIPFFVANSIFGYRSLSTANKKAIFYINFISPLATIIVSCLSFFFFRDVLLFVTVKLYARQILNLFFYRMCSPSSR